MSQLWSRFWNDQRGFVVSAEIVLILTIGVLGLVVGLSAVTSSVSNELNDVSSAIGAADQSYWYSGLVKVGHSGVSGSAFADAQDDCDCSIIVRTQPGVKTVGGAHRFRYGFQGTFGFRGAYGYYGESDAFNRFGFGAFGFGGGGFAIQLANGSYVAVGGGAVVVLADGSAVPVAGVFAIRLGDGTLVPLSAGFAVQLADGSLAIVSGATGIRLANGTVISLTADAFLILADGVRIPLASAAPRWAVGTVIALTDALAIRLFDGSLLRFPAGMSFVVGTSTLRPGAAILLANGTIITLAAPGAAGAPAVISAASVSAVVLSNGVSVPAGGALAIKLADGAVVPLAAGFAVRQANGTLLTAGGATALRLVNGTTVNLAPGSAIRLANGTLVPLASADRRYARGIQFSLQQAAALNLGGAASVNFPNGTILRIGSGPLGAGTKILLANGKTVVLAAGGGGVGMGSGTINSGNVAAVLLGNGTAIPMSTVHAIRLSGGTMLPLSAGFVVRLNNNMLVPMSGAKAVRLGNGSMQALVNSGSIRISDQVSVPMHSTGRGFAVGSLIDLGRANAIRLSDGKSAKLAAGLSLRVLNAARPAAYSVRITGDGSLALGMGAVGSPTPVVRGSLVSLANVQEVRDGRRKLEVSSRDSLRLSNGVVVRLSDVYAIRVGEKSMIPLNVGVAVKLSNRQMIVLTDATGLQLRKGKRKVAFTEKAMLRTKDGVMIPAVGCLGPGKGCLRIDLRHHNKPRRKRKAK